MIKNNIKKTLRTISILDDAPRQNANTLAKFKKLQKDNNDDFKSIVNRRNSRMRALWP